MNDTSCELTPLGFSDLTQHEAMLVSIFRIWYCQNASKEHLENSIRSSLQTDRIYCALSDLFTFFRIFVQHETVQINKFEVLSHTEERLIATLGSDQADDPANNVAQKCREKLLAIQMHPRHVNAIKRSGKDYVQAKLAQSYQKFMANPL